MGKLTRQHVIIIGSVLTVAVAVAVFFLLIRPKMDEMAVAQAKYDSNKAIADTKPLKEADLVKAKQEVQQERVKWARYERQYMPDINISSLLGGMQQRWREQSLVLGPMVQKYLRSDHTVRITSAGITIPAPPTDPNAVNVSLIELPLGSVTVQGQFNNVLKHTERWNRFRRLVQVDGLGLTGNSPNLTAQYTLKMYIFTRGEPGPAVPQAGGGGGGGGGDMSSMGGMGSGSGSPPP